MFILHLAYMSFQANLTKAFDVYMSAVGFFWCHVVLLQAHRIRFPIHSVSTCQNSPNNIDCRISTATPSVVRRRVGVRNSANTTIVKSGTVY